MSSMYNRNLQKCINYNSINLAPHVYEGKQSIKNESKILYECEIVMVRVWGKPLLHGLSDLSCLNIQSMTCFIS